MIPEIKTSSTKLLVGKTLEMTLTEDKTPILWQSFMPQRAAIGHKVSAELISMRIYNEPFRAGDLTQKFNKWAAVEVTSINTIPPNFKSYVVPKGLYAVFQYKGLNTDPRVFIYIYGTWLPNSKYEIDERPHFEILGEKYKNGSPDSEEEIWIPIKLKNS
jgi:AraC family transcriptional regulator